MFLQIISASFKMIPSAIVSLALILPSLLVVGNTTLDPSLLCEECVLVNTNTELGADDENLAGSYK